MNLKLFFQAIFKFSLGFILVVALIFIPAGSLLFINGWILIGDLFIPMLLVGILMLFKNPKSLEKRLNAKEKDIEQNIVVKLCGLMFIIGFVISGFGYRFNWYMLPKTVIVLSTFVFLVGYIIYAIVLYQNTYLSRTIEVQENQKVIDTGLYSIVRHPMYTATLLIFFSMPLILGSIYSFMIFLFYPILIIKRIKNEEEFLEKELKGYSEYMKKVKYRLIPFIW